MAPTDRSGVLDNERAGPAVERNLNAPAVTVVIPTYARPAKLEACLDGLARLDPVPGGFEVVTVDDGGPDSLEPLIATFKDRLTIGLVVRPRGGPAAARNSGVEVARGRFLAFIDDDCTPHPGWLSALVRELERRPDCLLGGCITNGLPEDPYATATQAITTYARQYYRSEGGNEPFFTTNNLALATERFRQVGGFDTSIQSSTAEDREFCDRWRSLNYPMAEVLDAEVVHAHTSTLGSFLRQHYHYGRGILAFRLLRRRREPSPLVPEPLSFYWNMILAPLKDRGRTHVWRGISLMIAAQLATVAGVLGAAIFDRPAARSRGLDVAPPEAAKRSLPLDESDRPQGKRK